MEDIRPLLKIAEILIGGTVATEDVVRRVVTRHPDSLWTFMRRDQIVGGLALLMLNPGGVQALLANTLDVKDPPDPFLATPLVAPAGIYIWAVGHVSASDGIVSVFARLNSAPYASAAIYGAPATERGLRFLQNWGLRPVPGHPRNLHEYVRHANPTAAA